MRLSHKKVFSFLSDKYNLKYIQEKNNPKNYHTLYKSDYNITIELIPAGKYMKTIYVMFNGSGLSQQKQDDIINDIEEQYTQQRIGQPVEWCIDYNTAHRGLVLYSIEKNDHNISQKNFIIVSCNTSNEQAFQYQQHLTHEKMLTFNSLFPSTS